MMGLNLALALTLAQVAPYKTADVSACVTFTGQELGAGCWVEAEDCQRMAKERKALRETLTEAEKVPAPDGFIGWKGVALLILGGVFVGSTGTYLLTR